MPADRDRKGGSRLLLGWLTRLAMLAGGVGLAVRFGVPAAAVPAGPVADPEDNGATGRGNPGVPASSQSTRAGHETADMDGRLMGRLVLGLFVTASVMVGIIFAFRIVTHGAYERAQPALTSEQRAAIVPPAPNLQADPLAEIARLHEAEDKLLGNYAWADAGHTRGRIPIERAKTLILGHPLETAP